MITVEIKAVQLDTQAIQGVLLHVLSQIRKGETSGGYEDGNTSVAWGISGREEKIRKAGDSEPPILGFDDDDEDPEVEAETGDEF